MPLFYELFYVQCKIYFVISQSQTARIRISYVRLNNIDLTCCKGFVLATFVRAAKKTFCKKNIFELVGIYSDHPTHQAKLI